MRQEGSRSFERRMLKEGMGNFRLAGVNGFSSGKSIMDNQLPTVILKWVANSKC